MPKTILMTADNKDGYKLEDLLDTLVVEIEAKSEKAKEMALPCLDTTLTNNNHIVILLKEAAMFQRETMAVHNTLRKEAEE